MPRATSNSDAFNAVAERQRRRILNLLTRGEHSVNDIARVLHIRQPQASKHLRVLKEVGLVSVRGSGKRRLYRLNGEGLKPIFTWVVPFERFWNESHDRLAQYLDDQQKKEK